MALASSLRLCVREARHQDSRIEGDSSSSKEVAMTRTLSILAAALLAAPALAVCGLIGGTAGTLYQKRYCAHANLWTATVIQYAAATVPMMLLAARFETMEIIWSGTFIAALAWLVLGLSVGAISLLYLLIRRGAVSRVASYFFMVPPTTALIAWAMFGEHLGPVALAGMAVAAVGVALVQRG